MDQRQIKLKSLISDEFKDVFEFLDENINNRMLIKESHKFRKSTFYFNSNDLVMEMHQVYGVFIKESIYDSLLDMGYDIQKVKQLILYHIKKEFTIDVKFSDISEWAELHRNFVETQLKNDRLERTDIFP